LTFLIGPGLTAQEIVLTFHARGAAATIDSIVAIKKTTGESVKVISANTLDISDLVTSVNSIDREAGTNRIYPNPFRDKAEIQYFSKQEDNLRVVLINPLGQIVDSRNYHVSPGIHRFEISGNTSGIYCKQETTMLFFWQIRMSVFQQTTMLLFQQITMLLFSFQTYKKIKNWCLIKNRFPVF